MLKLPSDFYALFLDKNLVYLCAYFQTPNEALGPTQERKLDYICRKLRLKSGQPQADLANKRVAEAGLSDRCRVQVRDYRQVDDPNGYDALASVGMCGHVGEKMK